MIPVRRGDEPGDLKDLREKQLDKLRGLGRTPKSDDIKGYGEVKLVLTGRQHHKCAWCEGPFREGPNDDVDHYRPKAEANRLPGCTDTHGYWWLAYTWSNLLFSCANCNRTEKNDKFPLDNSSVALQREEAPPKGELPLLLDPADLAVHPAAHIEFRWDEVSRSCRAQPRNHSVRGYWTVTEVMGLDRATLRELRTLYLKQTVLPKLDKLKEALKSAPWLNARLELNRQTQDADARRAALELFRELRAMLAADRPYVAATRDVLEQLIPNSELKKLKVRWPSPEELPFTEP